MDLAKRMNLPCVRVANIRRFQAQPDEIPIYVGRGTPLGNPYRIQGCVSRKVAITKYKTWLQKHVISNNSPQHVMFAQLVELARQYPLVLLCWCYPQPCHAEIIKYGILSNFDKHVPDDYRCLDLRGIP